MKDNVGECDSCHRKFAYEIIHNGFGDTAYAYCDACGMTAFVGGWDDTTKPAKAPLKIQGPIQPETEPWLLACSCGGRFRHNASPRCPHCNEPLSADAATSFIERNAEGTRSGWRWQRSWSGMYCLIIDGRVTKNNWRQPSGKPLPPVENPAGFGPPQETPRKRNPLLFPLLGVGISGVQAAQQIMASRNADPFGIWSIVAATVLAVLYLGRRPAAGTFMFYSLVPMYPVYFLATAVGLYSGPTRPAVYVVLAVIWILGTYFAWRWKREYAVFIAHGQASRGVNS